MTAHSGLCTLRGYMEASQSPAAAPQKDEPQVPLLHTLHDLGGQLPPSEQPTPSQIPQVLGAIVRVLEHAGVTVADELYPEEPVQVDRPTATTTADLQATHRRLAAVEDLLGKLLTHVGAEG